MWVELVPCALYSCRVMWLPQATPTPHQNIHPLSHKALSLNHSCVVVGYIFCMCVVSTWRISDFALHPVQSFMKLFRGVFLYLNMTSCIPVVCSWCNYTLFRVSIRYEWHQEQLTIDPVPDKTQVITKSCISSLRSVWGSSTEVIDKKVKLFLYNATYM